MWSLYKENKFLEPLVFSNGKNQESIVKEVVDLIKKGEKIVFIKGVCGTGKSAIALNISKELGKTSVVVPSKSLQTQYKKDYEKDKYVLKKDKEKLKIKVITGRKNHKCKFLEDNKNAIPKIKNEVNSKLHDIFAGKREEAQNEIEKDESAANPNIPCKIEIKEKNWKKLKGYLSQNNFIDSSNITKIQDVKRLGVASVCPYWSPAFPSKFEFKTPILNKAKQKKYMGIGGTEFTYYERKCCCPFYNQFRDYIKCDVIVFNSLKYKLESAMNRKPATVVEIIDECDEFLDSFSAHRNLNIDRLQNSLINFVSEKEDVNEKITELLEILYHLKKDKKINESIETEKIIPLKETGAYDVLKFFQKNNDFLEEVDEESYLFRVEETAKMFEGFMKESYVTVGKNDRNLIFSIVSVNLEKKFKEMVDKNKAIVLMSGTIHDEKVLREIFGLDSFKIIEAEIQNQGNIKIKRTGLEKDCRYQNFRNGKNSREKYLKALDKCIEESIKPTLVHVNSFLDLPSKKEIFEFSLKNLIERDKIKYLQEKDKKGEAVSEFKEGKIPVLFSTKVSRGVDFPGEECKTIVFTKYPNPNVKDAFWKILYKTKPNHYWDFYKDKARREILQRVYRGLRFKEDKVTVMSPDLRVIEFFEGMGKN